MNAAILRAGNFAEFQDRLRGGQRPKRERGNFVLHPRNFDDDESSDPDQEFEGFDEVNFRELVNQKTLPRTETKNLRLAVKDRGDYEVNNNYNIKPVRLQKSAPVSKTRSKVEASKLHHPHPMSASRLDLTDSVFDKKFKIIVEKTIKVLQDIRSLMIREIPPPDGEEDYQRRVKRVQEFSARFSRIYLYPLLRQMNDLSVIPNRPSFSGINQKIIGAHQTILQALQAYHNFLPSSVGKCASDKLKALLDQVVYLSQLYAPLKQTTDCPTLDRQSLNDEFVNALRNHSDLLLESLENFMEVKFETRGGGSGKNAGTKNVAGGGKCDADGKKKGLVQGKKSKNKLLQSRLSMYSSTTALKRDVQLRKAVDAANKKKASVKSRYKTSSFKHRPPVEKHQVVPLPMSNKFCGKRSSSMLKNTPLTTPIKEEEIKTMIGDGNPDFDVTMEQPNGAAPALMGRGMGEFSELLQLVRDGDKDGSQQNARKALEILRKCLIGAEGDGSLQGGDGGQRAMGIILTQLGCVGGAKGKLGGQLAVEATEEGEKDLPPERLQFVERGGSDVIKKKGRKESVVTNVSGAKNAKLICIRDDNSLCSSSSSEDEQDHADAVIADVHRRETMRVVSSQTQTKLVQPSPATAAPPTTSHMKPKLRSSQNTGLKINRLPKSRLKPLEQLSKGYAISIIQYKLEYYKQCQQNFMYRRPAKGFSPWMIMGKISDEILDDIILAVTKELEADEVLQNLYNAEFQY